jgi:hypothetical protein
MREWAFAIHHMMTANTAAPIRSVTICQIAENVSLNLPRFDDGTADGGGYAEDDLFHNLRRAFLWSYDDASG